MNCFGASRANQSAGIPSRLLGLYHRLENTTLAAALSIMIALAFAQILLRNLGHTGIYWADGLLRYLVLWIGLLGAMIATRERNHISVDVTSEFLPERWQASVRVLTDGLALLVCAALTVGSVSFVVQEQAGELMAFGKVPAWLAEIILPLSFLVMSLRFLGHLVKDLNRALVPPANPATTSGPDSDSN